MGQDIHTLQNWRKIFRHFLIFIELQLFLYYFVITKTMNLSHMKWKLL